LGCGGLHGPARQPARRLGVGMLVNSAPRPMEQPQERTTKQGGYAAISFRNCKPVATRNARRARRGSQWAPVNTKASGKPGVENRQLPVTPASRSLLLRPEDPATPPDTRYRRPPSARDATRRHVIRKQPSSSARLRVVFLKERDVRSTCGCHTVKCLASPGGAMFQGGAGVRKAR
jgi:hypothetical protein